MVPMIEAVCNQMPITSLGGVPRFHAERPLHFGLVSQRALDEKLALNTLAVHAPLIGNMEPFEAHAPAGSRVMGRTTNYPGGGAKRPTVRFAPRTPAVTRTRSFFGAPVACGLADAFGQAAAKPSAAPPAGVAALAAACTAHGLAFDTDRVGRVLPDDGPLCGLGSFRVEAVDYTDALSDTAQPDRLLAETGDPDGWDMLRSHRHHANRMAKRRGQRWRLRATSVFENTRGGLNLYIAAESVSADALPRGGLTLVHVYGLGRVFALAPIVLEACSARGVRAQLGAAPLQGGCVRVAREAGGSLVLQLSLSAEQLALGFCTQEHIEAAPWITRDLNEAAAVPTAGLAASLLSFDFGAPVDHAVHSPFEDCYKRTDVALVRFSGREWSLRRHEQGFRASLAKLYASGKVVAHEYAVCSPLPQCDDVVELHMLIRI
jgi:hypothetical protein